jgi:tetratricopeptide (TPR) repeat protein
MALGRKFQMTRRMKKVMIAPVLLGTALVFSHVPLTQAAGGGGESSSPPAATETTKDCFAERQWDPALKKYVRYSEKVNGVWDSALRRCIRPDKAGYLKSDLLQDAVRELAYAGRLEEAQLVLAQMDQDSDFVLTYLGFTHRKLGNAQDAAYFYNAALQQNPDNILARSYMGQGYVSEGKITDARVQLQEIRARGGEGTWAEKSLMTSIESGTGYSY